MMGLEITDALLNKHLALIQEVERDLQVWNQRRQEEEQHRSEEERRQAERILRRPKKYKLRNVTAGELRQLWPEYTFREIGQMYGVQPSSVYRRLRKLDCEYWWRNHRRRARRSKVLEWGIENREEILSMSTSQLAEQLGYSRRTVFRARAAIRQALERRGPSDPSWYKGLLH